MLPSDPEWPAFFTYGVFKPGQLGFLRIKDSVKNRELATVRGQLFERNGAALLDISKNDVVGGFVLLLQDSYNTYSDIGEVEPETQYDWEQVEVEFQGEHQGKSLSANVLVSATPATPREREIHSKHSKIDCQWWDGSTDPLFTHALTRIGEVLNDTPEGLDDGDPEVLNEWEAKLLFDLQMAYQLLWTAIERYLLLRYAEEGTVRHQDRHKMAGEEAFQEAVEHYIDRDIERVLNLQYPGSESIKLNGSNPETIIDFYWQLRNNVTHRGKGVRAEYDLLRESLEELLHIFSEVLDAAFEASGICACYS